MGKKYIPHQRFTQIAAHIAKHFALVLIAFGSVFSADPQLTSPAGTLPPRPTASTISPVPDETSQNAALETLHKQLKDDFAKSRPADRIILAQTLLVRGQQPKQEPSQRFVALREASDLACKYGDLDTALASAEELCTWFTLPRRDEIARVLSATMPKIADPEVAQKAIFFGMTFIESCIASDDYALAMRLSKDCDTNAKKLKDPILSARTKALAEHSKELHDEFVKLGELRDLLGEMTTDGHRRLGIFLCLVKKDWPAGLEQLAASDDQAWVGLASMDKAAQAEQEKPTNDGSAALIAGDAWREKFADLRGSQRESAQFRALTWYRRAATLLTPANRSKIEKRIVELERALGPAALRNLAAYPQGPALLLTFETDTLIMSGMRLIGVLDASGSGLRFPASGAVPVRGAHGMALQFDGTGQIEVGNPKALQISGNQTIAMWMNPSVLVERRNPLHKSYGAEGTFTLEINGSVNYSYGIGKGNADPYTSVNTEIQVSPKTWIHLALVRDFTTKKVTWYHNGKAEMSASTKYPEATISTLPLIVGNGYAGAFIGQLDDVAIWPRALSAQEITALYTATAPGR